MASYRARFAKTYDIPPSIRPRAGWGRGFDRSTGFSLRLRPDCTVAVFMSRTALRPMGGRRMGVFMRPQVLAYVVLCNGKCWTVQSEPTAANEAGLTIYTEARKAIAAGRAWASRASKLAFSVATLYEGITNAGKLSYELKGEATFDQNSNPTGWKVTGGVKYEK